MRIQGHSIKYIFLVWGFCIGLHGQQSNGLLLFNSQGKNAIKSFLTLPENGLLKPGNHFSLDFDLAIWKVDFGFIFTIINENDETITLALTDWKNPDTCYVELSVADQPAIVQFSIPKKELHKGNWFHFRFDYDLDTQKVSLSLNDLSSSYQLAKIPGMQNCRITFGFTTNTYDVTKMVVKNIRLSSGKNDKIIHSWPLDEVSGTIAHDVIGSKNGRMEKGEWLYRFHSQWQPVGEMIVHSSSRIEFDENNQRIIIIDENYIYFNSFNGKEEKIIKHEIEFEKFRIYHDKYSMNTYLYEDGRGNWGILNPDNGKINLYHASGPNDQYFTHGFFPVSKNDLYMLGGYGWYSYKNDLQKFNFSRHKWDTLSTATNDLYPRSLPTWVQGKDKHLFYVFGGGGSITGKQEAGVKEWVDLYQVDLNELSIKRLWENKEDKLSREIFHLTFDPKQGQLFLYAQPEDSNRWKIFELNENNSEMRPVGVKTEKRMEKIWLNSMHDELLGYSQTEVSKDSARIEFYSVLLPMTALTETAKDTAANLPLLLGISGVIIAGMIGIFLYPKWSERVKTSKSQKPVLQKTTPEKTETAPIPTCPVVINLFGSFQMQINGREINTKDWGSKKARELFLYILVNNHHGVTIEQITEVFWADVTHSSAINSRNVALSTIRRILREHAFILEKNNDLFKVNCDHDVDCDYYIFLNAASNGNFEPLLAEKALKLYGENGLLSGMNSDWLEPIKTQTELKSYALAKKLGDQFKTGQNWIKLEWLGNLMLCWDNLDKTAMEFVVMSLQKLDNLSKAKVKMEQFAELYKKELGEKLILDIG